MLSAKLVMISTMTTTSSPEASSPDPDPEPEPEPSADYHCDEEYEQFFWFSLSHTVSRLFSQN